MPSAPRLVAAFTGLTVFAGLTGGLGWSLVPGTAHAAGPQVNLTVSWRLDTTGRSQATRQVVQGQVIVDSRGQVIGRTGLGATTVDTEASQQTEQMLQVLNGQQARLHVGRQVGRQSWQIVWSPPSDGGGSQAGGQGSHGLHSQTTWVDLGEGLVVRPRWAGGRQPVRLEIEAPSSRALNPGSPMGAGFEPDGQVGRTEVSTTLALPLGQWTAIAQSGHTRQTDSRRSGGTQLSTRELDDSGAQTLWVRVSLPGGAPAP